MDGSPGVCGSIVLEQDSEPSRIERELWSQVYQQLVPVGFVCTSHDETISKTVAQEEQNLVPAA